jgi:hypothetical protein
MANVKSLGSIKKSVYNLAGNKLRNNEIVEVFAKDNWGVLFIAGFMFLLIGAAVSFSVGLFSLADAVAFYAFYALVVGVFLQFICFFKFSRKDEDEAI